jgi:hypothetical protein
MDVRAEVSAVQKREGHKDISRPVRVETKRVDPCGPKSERYPGKPLFEGLSQEMS